MKFEDLVQEVFCQSFKGEVVFTCEDGLLDATSALKSAFLEKVLGKPPSEELASVFEIKAAPLEGIAYEIKMYEYYVDQSESFENLAEEIIDKGSYQLRDALYKYVPKELEERLTT